MKSINKKILIPVLVLIVIAIIAAGILLPKNDNTQAPENQASQTQTTENNETNEIPNPAYTEDENPTENNENINGLDKPIFMYFVTNSDLENETTKQSLEKLQKEYDGRVIFEIRNADEDPSLYDNFPIEGAMPMLIMQKKGGDIANFLFSTNDYESLKAAIEPTL